MAQTKVFFKPLVSGNKIQELDRSKKCCHGFTQLDTAAAWKASSNFLLRESQNVFPTADTTESENQKTYPLYRN